MYLHCLRAVAADSPESACLRFGVDLNFARWAAALTALEIEELSGSSYVFFKLTLSPEAFEKILSAPSEKREILFGLAPKEGTQNDSRRRR